MSDRDTTQALVERLERHYIKPDQQGYGGGVFLPECGTNGFTGSRADALYVGFTSNSGRQLIGHEIKVSRADWRRELDHAGKADLWADNCHAWYIVAPSTEIVPPAELPHGWGLMVPSPRSANRMKVEVAATVHPERVPSWDVTRSMMARLDTLQRRQLLDVHTRAREQVEETVQRRVADYERRVDGEVMTPETQQRLALLDRLENILGTKLDTYAWDDDDKVRPEVAAAALRLVEAAKTTGQRVNEHTVSHLRAGATAVLAGLDELAAGLADLRAVTEEGRR